MDNAQTASPDEASDTQLPCPLNPASSSPNTNTGGLTVIPCPSLDLSPLCVVTVCTPPPQKNPPAPSPCTPAPSCLHQAVCCSCPQEHHSAQGHTYGGAQHSRQQQQQHSLATSRATSSTTVKVWEQHDTTSQSSTHDTIARPQHTLCRTRWRARLAPVPPLCSCPVLSCSPSPLPFTASLTPS